VVVAVALLAVGLVVLTVIAAAIALVLLLQGLAMHADYRRRLTAAEPKPADGQIDDLMRADLQLAAERALHRLGLTRADLELHSEDLGAAASDGTRRLAGHGRDPVWVFGPAEQARTARIGRDRKWRFARYSVMVICPTVHHLAIYECELDLATGGRSGEETHEYHYADVVAVRTATSPARALPIEVLGPTGLLHSVIDAGYHRDFQVVVSSGDRTSIIVGLHREDDRDDSVLLRESGYEQVISAVRGILRARKGGVAHAT
jgi:hypothetical protein